MASEREIVRALSALTASRTRIRDDARQIWNLLQSRSVVGVGVAEKISRNQPTGQLALTFYVEKKLSLEEIPAHELIPPAVPRSMRGRRTIPIDVVALGRLRPHANVTRQAIQPGFSIGHVKAPAGTLGAIVMDNSGQPQM